MTKLRLKLGTYDTELTQEEFTVSLRAWLSARGTISETAGRGLVVSRHSTVGRPGNIGQIVLGFVRDNPGISEAQLGRKLGDYSPNQVKSAIRRLVKNEDISGGRVSYGIKHFVYSITPKGETRLDEFLEAERNAKELAVRAWAGIKTLGYKRDSIVDYEELLGATEMTRTELGAALKALVKAQRMTVTYASGEMPKYRIG